MRSRWKVTLVVSVCLLVGFTVLFRDRSTPGDADSYTSNPSLSATLSVHTTSRQSDTNKPPKTVLSPRTETLSDGTTRHAHTGNQSRSTILSTPKATIRSVADLYERLVCVTAFSDNHFHEAIDMIAGLQTCLPGKKIVVYDLGLNSAHREEVSGYCNVELRSFPFNDYQSLRHVKNLFTYAWKPIITKLLSLEYDVILYGDASLRMKSCNISKALAHLLNFPYLSVHPIRMFYAIEFAHDGMIKYLHYPKARKDIAKVGTLEGGFLVWANSVMQEKFIDPWLDCALHEECISPKGAKRLSCPPPPFTKNHDGHYVGCHRYDQSAAILILTREFGLDAVDRAANREVTNMLWNVIRGPTHKYQISHCRI